LNRADALTVTWWISGHWVVPRGYALRHPGALPSINHCFAHTVIESRAFVWARDKDPVRQALPELQNARHAGFT
jgi:hypothetical protein